MDQLVNKIKNAIETQFRARLVNITVTRQGDMWGIQFGSPIDSYKVVIEVVESKHKINSTEYPAHSIQDLLRSDINLALGDGGRLMSISTNMDNYGFRSTLEFVTQDVYAFASNLEDMVYKAYSNQFDSLMTETLSED